MYSFICLFTATCLLLICSCTHSSIYSPSVKPPPLHINLSSLPSIHLYIHLSIPPQSTNPSILVLQAILPIDSLFVALAAQRMGSRTGSLRSPSRWPVYLFLEYVISHVVDQVSTSPHRALACIFIELTYSTDQK